MKQLTHTIQHPIDKTISIPGSKSITNRALLLAALADGTSHLKNLLISDDTRAMLQALQQLGVALTYDTTTLECTITGVSGKFPQAAAHIDCQRAGTVARFLLAACAATAGKFNFDGDAQLRGRPMGPLLQVLTAQGASIEPFDAQHFPVTVTGANGFQGGEIAIDSQLSGQFLSGMLMAAPFAKSAMTIEAQQLGSEAYVEMTCDMMAEFGVLVKRLHQQRYHIPVPQRYRAREYIIEPDFSTASYFFAAAAVTGGKMTIPFLQRAKSKQPDAAFLTVLEKMGCHVEETLSGITVTGAKELRGVNIDMRNFSDTFMTLAAIAPFATTPTTITNIGHTRVQESNRISAMKQELEKLHVKAEEGPDWLRIYPSTPEGSDVESHHDHRIAMSLAVIGLRTPHIVIHDAEAVAKTCPPFFELWKF